MSAAGPRPDALHRALHPRSIAVIGASTDPTKRGHQVVRALLARGFPGRVYPVNPRAETILGLPVHPTVESIPEVPDLAVISTPADGVPEVVASCGRRGVPAAVVLSAGFKELGTAGLELEERLAEAARAHGIRVIGPNTSGIMSLGAGVDLIGIGEARKGRLALVVQSGNQLLDLVKEAAARPGEGLSTVIGLGNQTDVRLHELLAPLARDPDVGAILIHAESFLDGASFLEAARQAARSKPLVVLKGGRTKSGSRAARSHTGAVATDDVVVRSALRQAGVVEVRRTDDLLAVGRTLESQPAARSGSGLAVLADGGGHGTLAADALEEFGVPLAELSDATRARLRTLLGPNAATDNPVDLAGASDRDPVVFGRALRTLVQDPEVAGVLLVGLFGGYAIRFASELEPAETATAHELVDIARSAGKPLVAHSIYEDSGSRPILALRDGRVPVFRSLDTACRAVAATWERGQLLTLMERSAAKERAAAQPARPDSNVDGARKSGPPTGSGPATVSRPRAEEPRLPTGVVTEPEVRALLESYGVPFVPARHCLTAADVADAVRAFGRPVVLKAISGTVTHKTDAGGVALDVGTEAEAMRAFREIIASVTRYAEARGLEPDLRGVLVSPQLPSPAVELLVGAHRDESFGPVLTLGAGGVAVEIHRDVAIRVLPVDADEVDAMLSELRIRPLIDGYRGRKGTDRSALMLAITGLARCFLDRPEIEELEINPLFAGPEGVHAVDARATLSAVSTPR